MEARAESLSEGPGKPNKTIDFEGSDPPPLQQEPCPLDLPHPVLVPLCLHLGHPTLGLEAPPLPQERAALELYFSDQWPIVNKVWILVIINIQYT